MYLNEDILKNILEKAARCDPKTYIKLGISSKFLYDNMKKKLEKEYKIYEKQCKYLEVTY